MFRELDENEMMQVDGGLGNGGKLVMVLGGAIIAGIAAPIAGAVAVTYGTVAVVSTVAGSMVVGYGMMSTGMSK